MSKGKTGRPQGPSIMPTDNDWRVLRVIVRAIFRTSRMVSGAPHHEPEAFCTLSLVDIGEEIGMHPMSVRKHVRRLEERGLLRRERAAGASPTVYCMPMRTLRAVYAFLDDTVGLDGPWPSRDNYKI